jgi:hypothetical protein
LFRFPSKCKQTDQDFSSNSLPFLSTIDAVLSSKRFIILRVYSGFLDTLIIFLSVPSHDIRYWMPDQHSNFTAKRSLSLWQASEKVNGHANTLRS